VQHHFCYVFVFVDTGFYSCAHKKILIFVCVVAGPVG